ncbi:MAG: hypothetical protein AAF740_01885 [Bacteroidota bacterium]
MTEEQAKEVVRHLKEGKFYRNETGRTYMGDYYLTVVSFRDNSFYIKLYSCHDDAGEFLATSSERSEKEIIKYFQIGDYERTMACLKA